jgi:hypothetical protein
VWLSKCVSQCQMPFRFITAIPLNVWKGSGGFVGMKTGVRALGGEVNFVTPRLHLPKLKSCMVTRN